jgi:DNA-binding NarL/FixJ family response regulator
MSSLSGKRTQSNRRARVLLIEDHPLLRRGLAACINDEADLFVCGEAPTAAAAIKQVAAHKPDMAVVDISLPDGHGLEVIKDLKAVYPRLRTLVLSMHEEKVYAARALRAGALGYVMKREPPAMIIRAIRTVARGNVFFSLSVTRDLLQRLAGQKASAVACPEEQLSDRELEVFECLGNGAQPKTIARQFHLSPKTVLAHRENIKRKLALKSAAELALFCLCLGAGPLNPVGNVPTRRIGFLPIACVAALD